MVTRDLFLESVNHKATLDSAWKSSRRPIVGTDPRILDRAMDLCSLDKVCLLLKVNTLTLSLDTRSPAVRLAVQCNLLGSVVNRCRFICKLSYSRSKQVTPAYQQSCYII